MTNAQAVPTDGHLPTLDGLRGVAILLVMMHHLFVVQPVSEAEQIAGRVAALGAHGVDLFFVLSGFLITGILLDGKGRPKQLKNFYVRRVLRIFPLYYLVLGICFLALPAVMQMVPAAVGKLARFQGAVEDWPWYVLYLSNFAIAIAGQWRHGVLDVAWSLAIEEQFYLLWPWVVLGCSRRVLERVCLGLILLAISCRVGVWAFEMGWLTAYVLTPCRMDTLAIGAWLAARFRAKDGELGWAIRPAWGALAVGLPLVVGAASLGGFAYHQPWVYTFGYTLVGVLAAAALILAVTSPPGSWRTRLLTSRPLIVFGKYSYAIYLFHLPVRAVIRDLAFGDEQFRHLPFSPFFGQLLFYVVATLAVVPSAMASWYLLEARFLSLKRYFPTNRSTPHDFQ